MHFILTLVVILIAVAVLPKVIGVLFKVLAGPVLFLTLMIGAYMLVA